MSISHGYRQDPVPWGSFRVRFGFFPHAFRLRLVWLRRVAVDTASKSGCSRFATVLELHFFEAIQGPRQIGQSILRVLSVHHLKSGPDRLQWWQNDFLKEHQSGVGLFQVDSSRLQRLLMIGHGLSLRETGFCLIFVLLRLFQEIAHLLDFRIHFLDRICNADRDRKSTGISCAWTSIRCPVPFKVNSSCSVCLARPTGTSLLWSWFLAAILAEVCAACRLDRAVAACSFHGWTCSSMAQVTVISILACALSRSASVERTGLSPVPRRLVRHVTIACGVVIGAPSNGLALAG